MADPDSIERFATRFFDDYAAVFHRTERVIGEATGLGHEDLHRFTQTLFNRLMVLRFVERRGWLHQTGKDQDRCLAAMFTAGGFGSHSAYRARLRPLFFEGRIETAGNGYGSVESDPWFRGGLFEPTSLDDRVTDLPDEALAPLIGADGLFYRYAFAVDEPISRDSEFAIDPEMLGTVFEELVTGRHGSGAYYTPRPVVAFMCREALKRHLSDRTGQSREAIARLVDEHSAEGLSATQKQALRISLSELKAVDPACGSGAYLVGLLRELIAVYQALQPELGLDDARHLFELKMHIITHVLHGVDIDQCATEITRLRLWLTLVADADRPMPLPNLGDRIVTGDALLGPCESAVDGRHERNGTAVNWHAQFADVFGSNGGFDLVITNPPYIRHELLDKSLKEALRATYPSGVTGMSDLYCYFYVRGLQLLRPGGVHVFICSNSWLDVGYGGALQRHLLEHAQIDAVYDCAVERQFSTADVNTIISVLRKRASTDSPPTRFVRLNDRFLESIRDRGLRRELSVSRNELLTTIRNDPGESRRTVRSGKWGGLFLRAPGSFIEFRSSDCPLLPLGSVDLWTLGRGRRTGCDSFFYLGTEDVERWCVEEAYLRPLVKSPSQFMDVPPCSTALPSERFVFLCHRSIDELAGTRALGYIRHGEAQGVHEGNLAAACGRWYDLGPQTCADIILPIAFNDRFFVIENDGNCEIHQRFATLAFRPEHRSLITVVTALLSSIIVPLTAESTGRRSMGQGALDFPPEDWRGVLIPDPRRLSEESILRLRELWNSIRVEPPVRLRDAWDHPLRRELDELVLMAIGMDQALAERAYGETRDLLNDRLVKAQSRRPG